MIKQTDGKATFASKHPPAFLCQKWRGPEANLQQKCLISDQYTEQLNLKLGQNERLAC